MAATKTLQKRPPAIVIGSGPNGLSCAIALAQSGLSVTVLEGSSTLGGGCRSDELCGDGFVADVCSSIHPMAIASPFWNRLDLPSHGLTWVHPEVPFAHPLDDGPAALAYRSVDQTADELGADAGTYRGRFAPLAARFDDLVKDAMAPLGIPAHPLLLARFGLTGFCSAERFASAFQEPRTRALFGGAAGHSVLPFDMLPSASIGYILQLAAHGCGWPFPQGGAQSLTDALLSVLKAAGGEVRTDASVTSLEELPEDALLFFDTAPQNMARICGHALPHSYRQRLTRYRMGPGVFKIDYALSEPIPWKDPRVHQAATVHLGGTFEEMARSEKNAFGGVLDDAPYVLLTQTTRFDPSRAPAGKHTAWAYCHVPAGSTSDRTAVVEAQIERFAPGFSDVVTARHTMSADAFERYNANYIGGDVVGGAATVSQLFTRPVARISPYTTPNPRIFLCSASTPPGGGVHGMCGYYAAKAAGFAPAL